MTARSWSATSDCSLLWIISLYEKCFCDPSGTSSSTIEPSFHVKMKTVMFSIRNVFLTLRTDHLFFKILLYEKENKLHLFGLSDQLCWVKHNLFSETKSNRNFLARSLDNIHLGKRDEINTPPRKGSERWKTIRNDLINHAKNISKSNK